MLPNILDNEDNVDADDNERENTNSDLVEQSIGKLAHDKGT